MSDRRDAGKSLVTDYSRSSMDPERAARLNKAELEYVNGIWDTEDEEWIWPSYPSLAERHDIPIHTINEQANKHKWVSRRERRKTEMIAFQNEQTRKAWLEQERQIQGVMLTNAGRAVATISRLQDEHHRLILAAYAEEDDRRYAGEENPIVRVGIRASEVEGLARAAETVSKTLEKLVARINGLPTTLPEIAPPTLILTVEQEAAEQEQADEAAMPQTTLLEVFQEMRKIEELRARTPKVIYGELEDGDE